MSTKAIVAIVSAILIIFLLEVVMVLYAEHGRLINASIGRDGYVYPKGLFFQIDISGNAPALVKQGVIDPGFGVAVQMPSVDEDQQGNLGFSWIESSTTEFLSIWVGALDTKW
jgi:hypothetical protein